MLDSVGLHYKMGKMEGIWLKALSFESKQSTEVALGRTISVESLLKSLRALHHIE